MGEFPIAHRRLRANGIELHVAEAGAANGPLLVLLHGFPEFWFAWRDYMPALAELGFHVVAPDQRGYNLSDKPRGIGAYGLDLLADDIAELTGDLGYDSFQVVGHDWGGSVAWSLDRPRRARDRTGPSAALPDTAATRMTAGPCGRCPPRIFSGAGQGWQNQ
jgi:pimeloyl-ACP methyl ester carboxylesterase